MARKSTGTVRILRQQWHAKWTRADGSRIEWEIPVDDLTAAKACASRMAPKIRAASRDDPRGVQIRVLQRGPAAGGQ